VKVFSSLALVSMFHPRECAKQKDQMPIKFVLSLALASGAVSSTVRAAVYAETVVNYVPGTGVQAGNTLPASALGEPSRITPGQFGGPVDPFNPPYLGEQIVSIGAGGSLTLGFGSPVANEPSNPFGLDFIIFGNAGFQIVNGDFSGGGITDGSLFGANSGPTRVSVSSDGQTFYELSPSLTPVVDGPFPTDGSGNVFSPLDPALKSSSFNGKDLAGIRQLYNGSAGGAAFDISWARTPEGQPINLSSIQFVRVDVLSGVSEIDAVTVVPEPTVLCLLGVGALALCWRTIRRSS
jgi:hypothetical protein